MGTQQILLIVLSVIIVGVAIAVGINMFNNQAYNSNKTAIAADAQSFATQVVQYYKTPTSQGGGGQALIDAGATPPVTAAATATALSAYLGWTSGATFNDNGLYAITNITATSVVITGHGKTAKGSAYGKVVTTISFPDGTIASTLSDDGTASSPTAFTGS
jgi:hypothetical protein